MADDEVYHDEVEIEDFEYDEETQLFTYPCPCGDLFTVAKDDLLSGLETATCPSCSLVVKVIFNPEDIEDLIQSRSKKKIKEREASNLQVNCA